VIEPAWLWPQPTMRPPRREEMPGSRLDPALPTPACGSGDGPAVSSSEANFDN